MVNKAVLVIDVPETCKECPICISYEIMSSIEEYTCAVKNINVDLNNKPDWCPLKLVPEKYDIETERNKPHNRNCNWEFESGYNQCINEILGK